MNELDKALAAIMPANRIKTRLIDCLSFASDAGFYHLVPRAVVQPVSTTEIKGIFNWCSQKNMPLVFRGGGTSLSGQSITDGILVDLGRHWRGVEVDDEQKTVTVQPGITGSMVNHFLKKTGAKIGPDPSSIHAAMMGGILSNNASGMCCGVAHNSYHTLKYIGFVLTNGAEYHTQHAVDYTRFLIEQTALCEGLIALRQQILANNSLETRIRKKYQTKNTVGYGLNALIDYEHPLDIFAHLLIGAEGTLAFIAEATLVTLPDKPYKAAAMLYFSDIYLACQAILPLTHSGAEALELMDRASLKSIEHLDGLPDYFKDLPESAAAILCEYQTDNEADLVSILQQINPVLDGLNLLHAVQFAMDEPTRQFYWKIRKGMFPSVGAVRAAGTTVILEDIAFPVDRLADAVADLHILFKKFGYNNAIIFGHAKDGNLHFVITQQLDTEPEIIRYDTFLKAVVELVVHKYDGALKAEHGTGRNMAPFVEVEWGSEALAIMQKIKSLADPKNILNPGVIINADASAHIKHLKDLPVVESEVDKCIECGFCEPVCPSRDHTMTPRQRIVARRALQRLDIAGNIQEKKELLSQYQYDGLDSCATDGLCATECPVQINTGDLVKRLRREQHGKTSNKVAAFMARNFLGVEKTARVGLGFIGWADGLFGWHAIYHITHGLRKIFKGFPIWMKETGMPPRKVWQEPAEPQVVYFSACISRLMNSSQHEQASLQQTLLNLAQKAGVQVLLPKNLPGHCCGQPFSSKGFSKQAAEVAHKTIDALLVWTRNGELPVFCDFSSCTYTLLQNQPLLDWAYQEKFKKLKWIDSLQFLETIILPRLTIHQKKDSIGLHATCAVTKMKGLNSIRNIARACANEVIEPAYGGCCGMAGDRGFITPGLPESAISHMANDMAKTNCNGYYSSAVTCEMALQQWIGKPYAHIAYLVDDCATKPNG